LRKLLERVSIQRSGGQFTVSVSIVDNDPGLSGRPVVEEFRAAGTLDVVYTPVPDRNLALLRNISVQQAAGDYVAFIDDDEYPVTDWLLLLLGALGEFRAAGALGPILPEYLTAPPDWIVRGRFCERDRFATGTRLHYGQTRTGNALVKRAVLLEDGLPFDPKHRLGGEDDSLFRKLIERGHEFVWCDEAAVYEQIPAARLTLDYFVRRSRLIGYMTYDYPRADRSRLQSFLLFGKSCLAAGVYGLLMPLARIRGYHRFARLRVRYEFHKAVLRTHLGRLRIDDREI
jgi:succinoglycan biosynthesis protein ExoM